MPDEKSIPEVNVGVVGHVDHGKTTITSVLTGKFTDEHSEELKRGITIRLGYADVTIRKCKKCGNDPNLGYMALETCFNCKSKTEILRTISFIDVPGHESLLATVLTGASLMDGAILVIAANEECPQPQTAEHLGALNIAGIKNIIVVQNKIDLVSEEEAIKNYEQIKAFLKGSVAENAPIIPVSAQHCINIGVIFKAIEDIIKTPHRDLKAEPKMLVARTFDVNRPGTEIKNLVGGVLGGGLTRGILKEGDEIEVLPGILKGKEWKPMTTKITSIIQGKAKVKEGKPGGLLALSTTLDPYLTKSDNLASSVIGKIGELPRLQYSLTLEVHLLKRVLISAKGDVKVNVGDGLLINIGTQKTAGLCKKIGSECLFDLKRPVSAEKNELVAISKQVGERWHLIGYGIVK